MRGIALTPVATCLLALPSLAQDVWVVDAAGGPGSDFVDLPSAVAAASAGDTVLVREGTYDDGFTIDNLKLHVLAEEGAAVVVRGPIVVRNLGPLRWVVLRGLDVENAEVATGPALRLEDNAGTVWVEDCALEASGAFNPLVQKSGVWIEGCDEVALVRTTARAAEVSGLFADGLTLIDSSAHLFDVSAFGDRGMPGARLQDAFVFASGGTFVGGDGTDGVDGPFGSCAGDGGHGVYLQSGSNELVLLATAATGGAPGAPSDQCGDPALPGETVQVSSGTVSTLEGPARGLVFDAPAAVGGSTTLVIDGEAGDFVFLLLAAAPDPFFAAAFAGSLLPQLPVIAIPFGTLPPSGTLSLELPVPALAPGAESVAFFTQGAFVATDGERRLGAGSALVFLAAEPARATLQATPTACSPYGVVPLLPDNPRRR